MGFGKSTAIAISRISKKCGHGKFKKLGFRTFQSCQKRILTKSRVGNRSTVKVAAATKTQAHEAAKTMASTAIPGQSAAEQQLRKQLEAEFFRTELKAKMAQERLKKSQEAAALAAQVKAAKAEKEAKRVVDFDAPWEKPKEADLGYDGYRRSRKARR